MKNTMLPVCLALMLLALSCQTSSKNEPSVVEKSSISNDNISIATVDTDSIFKYYDFVTDVMGEIEASDKKLSQDLQNRAKSFQNEYENYLKIGASMTLSEQKKTEERLQKQQQDLQMLEQKYSEQLMQLRGSKTQELQDKIFSFIEAYNQEHHQFTLILSKSRTTGVMYADSALDITQEVLDALNEEYSSKKKK